MKLLRVGAVGAERPAILAPDGTTRDLSAHIADFTADVLSPTGLAKLAALNPASLPQLPGQRIGPCVPRPVNFVCIGLNYADHAAETGAPIPKEPIIFLKSLGAFQGPNDDVRIPAAAPKRTGKSNSASSLAKNAATSRKTRPWNTWPAIAS